MKILTLNLICNFLSFVFGLESDHLCIYSQNAPKQKSGLRIGSNSFTPKVFNPSSTKSVEEYEISGVEQANEELKSSESK